MGYISSSGWESSEIYIGQNQSGVRGSPHAAGGRFEVDSSSSTILNAAVALSSGDSANIERGNKKKLEVDDEIRGTARRSTISYARTFFYRHR
jgi:hypothetical protein